MKHIVNLWIVGIVALCISSCDSKFDDINTNPDAPIVSTAEMEALHLILGITNLDSQKYFVYDNMYSKQIAWGEDAQNEQYNNFGRTDFESYTLLTNVQKMIELALDADKEAYTGLGKFIRAYKIFYFSLEVGDVPYSDALKGEEGNLTPKYDTQKEVMQNVLKDLEEAYTHFSAAGTFSGDPIYSGKPEAWKKAVTAMQLKVLMHLSKKTADTDLKVKEKFAQIVANQTLMTSNADNFQLVYADKAGQVYPFNIDRTKHWVYSMLSTTIADPLKAAEDYRLFYFANPIPSIAEEKGEDSFDAYIGVDPSEPITVVKDKYNTKQFCGLNSRYTHYKPGEPLIRLGYSEQNFILAEAAARGWITGDASTYYKTGITASFDFLRTYTPDDATYHHGRKITDEAIEAAVNHPVNQLTGNTEDDLNKILTQRYVASFFQYPYDAYFDYRRTGYPVLPINPTTNLNAEKDKIPVRWMYPQSEYSYNGDNVKEAVQRQYSGSDDVNKLMWILQD